MKSFVLALLIAVSGCQTAGVAVVWGYAQRDVELLQTRFFDADPEARELISLHLAAATTFRNDLLPQYLERAEAEDREWWERAVTVFQWAVSAGLITVGATGGF